MEAGRLVVPSDPEESERAGRGHRCMMEHSADGLRSSPKMPGKTKPARGT